MGSYTKSNEYGKKAVNLGKKRYGELSLDNAAMLSNLAVRLANVRNYEKALEYAHLARSIYQRMNATRQLGYTRLLGNMASFNAQLEKNEECLALLNEELPLLRELVGESHPDYVRCHSELSSAYSRMGNYEKAEEVGQMAQQITDSTTLSDPRYAQAMSREANTLAMNGKFERAVEMENRALQVFTNRHDTLMMGNSITQLAYYTTSLKDYATAKNYALSAVRILESKDMSHYRAQAYNVLSIVYYYTHDYDSAYVYGAKAIDCYVALNDTATSVYANASLYYNLASFYNLEGGHSADVCDNYSRALELQTDVIRKNFSHQTAVEREKFWNTKSYLYRVAPSFAYTNDQEPRLIADAYNAKLFTTGLLLNSEVNFHKLLAQVKDSVMLEKYNRLDLLRKEIDACYQLPMAERAERVKAAEAEAESLEKQLVKGCKAYGDFIRPWPTSWGIKM